MAPKTQKKSINEETKKDDATKSKGITKPPKPPAKPVKDDEVKQKGKGGGKKKGKKGKREKKKRRCDVKRRKKATKRKCTDMFEKNAMYNLYYIAHAIGDALKIRSFVWKKKK